MKRIMVNSHERSGTHFLINSLADNFGFQSHPWIDLDNLPILPYIPNNMMNMMKSIANDPKFERMIVKSHYSAEFFDGVLDEIAKQWHIFYIYRNSEDTMKSYWKHFKDVKEKQNWNAGPVGDNTEHFKKMMPYGACLRYQYNQYDDMEQRHLYHVSDWSGNENIIYVKYEDLNDNFENEMRAIALKMDLPLLHGEPIRPNKDRTVKEGVFQK